MVSKGLPIGGDTGTPEPPSSYRNQELDILPGALCTFRDRHFLISFLKMQIPQRWAEGHWLAESSCKEREEW